MESAANPALSTDREDLEDLALWTESASSSHKLTGGSLMHLKGVFFLPNAYPFNLHGGAGQLAKDAQYIVRSLNATGGAQVYMQPNAYNAPKLPTLESFTLVR